MRVPSRRLQVFVSSTFTDLREERQAAVAAILGEGHIPAGMELFAAESAEQMAVIREWIEESDVFLLLLAGRYGSVEPVSKKSYTELEYEHALSLGKPVLAMVMEEGTITARERERQEFIERNYGGQLAAFRSRVLNNGKMAAFFTSTDSLEGKIGRAIRTADRSPELVGWVRRTDTVDATTALNQMMALTEENKTLKAHLEQARTPAAGTAGFVPPLATKMLSIPCKSADGTTFPHETNYFDWFLFCGRRFIDGVSIGDFSAVTSEYFKTRWASFAIEGLMPTQSFEDLASEALKEFTFFGWIHDPKQSIKGQVMITPDGRNLFLRHAGR